MKLIKCRHKNQVISIIDVDYFYDKFVLYLKISNCVPDTTMQITLSSLGMYQFQTTTQQSVIEDLHSVVLPTSFFIGFFKHISGNKL